MMKWSTLKIITGLVATAVVAVTAVSLSNEVVANPPVTGEIKVPQEVKQLLERACYDCHSNETNIRWYDKLPIASAIVSRDVQEGRKHFNFSTWDSLSANEQKSLLWEMYNMANAGRMPLPAYTAIHPQSKVSAADLTVLKNYLNTTIVSAINDTAKVQAAAKQRMQQVQQPQPGNLRVYYNGIQHMPDYHSWQVMSTTSRFDNGSMRIMYANAIAMEAIKRKEIHPFPDGAIIAKLVWEKLEDGEGNVRPGKFINIQYMVRDAQQFKDTDGWGYARFDGPALKPYGTATEPSKCASCHKAAATTGFVFDLPTKN
ncbi:heme-binding domain-containing protein [Longitalea arenae]|uniref:heme-binding domain-containing protein n=1 Tax=Longitalea arenae TaxID=2812558 RepID=UPI001967E115|nr:heme-binding domain-containing protein [Longitalea arenae]